MRLIDGDALIEKFNEKVDMAERLIDERTAERFATFCAIADAVEEMPTADAEVVVRCKDCKYWHKETLFCDYMPYGEARERVNWYADDFCSYGERKDGDGNG